MSELPITGFYRYLQIPYNVTPDLGEFMKKANIHGKFHWRLYMIIHTVLIGGGVQ